jgi:hypothetical protein
MVTLLSIDLVFIKFVRNVYSVMYHRRVCTVGLKTMWTRLRSGRSEVRFPAVARDFSLLISSHIGSGYIQAPVLWVRAFVCKRLKRLQREFDRSCLSIAERRNFNILHIDTKCLSFAHHRIIYFLYLVPIRKLLPSDRNALKNTSPAMEFTLKCYP